DFTQGNLTRQLITFAWPLFLSNLLQVVYNMVDMVVVGHHLGKTGLSAVSIGGDVTHFLTFIAMGFSSAGQVIISRYIGAKQTDKLGRFVGTMGGFLMVCALAMSLAALGLRRQILDWMSTPLLAYSGALDYSSISMAGLVFIYGYNIVSAILRGMGDSKHPFVFISLAAVMNLVLDLWFVMGLDMGPGGAALATVISQAVSFVACAVFLVRHRSQFQLKITRWQFIRWDKAMLVELVRLGTPMAIKSAAIQVSKLFVNSWINSFSLEVSAFAGVANKVASISNLVSNAINTAGSTMVGQNIAAGLFKRVNQLLVRLSALSLSIAAGISTLVCLFPMPFFSLFTSDKAVLAIVPQYVPIAVMLFFGSALRAIMNSLINGSGNYKINCATAILDGIVMRIGLALLFGLVLEMEAVGFWLGDALAGFTPFWIGLVFYFSGRWKKGRVLRES
ncbi:MAG: MATE family efflux transporter, partial [Clostridia bacterium]|nr:MATE family efflux transporter [Clostridia bacterium]